MVIETVPMSSYLETLISSIKANGYNHQQLVELLFGLIGQFCEQVPQRRGPGRPKLYPDSTILKLVMLMHLTGKRGETELLREVKRHYQCYFEVIPEQSRLWYRIRELLPLMEQFRRYLKAQLGVDAEEIRILDSMPVPVATATSRPGKGNGFDLADGGYCESKKLSYYGFKLGLLITHHGIPDCYDLFSARPHDIQLLTDLLGDATDILALGDKGFVSDPIRDELADGQNVILLTYRRRNQHQQNTPWEHWILHQYRQLIETVFSQLHGHMHIQNTGAKTDVGLVKRIMGIVTAFTLGIFLNSLLDRPLLAIKALFA